MYAGDEQNAMPITELHFCTTVLLIAESVSEFF